MVSSFVEKKCEASLSHSEKKKNFEEHFKKKREKERDVGRRGASGRRRRGRSR